MLARLSLASHRLNPHAPRTILRIVLVAVNPHSDDRQHDSGSQPLPKGRSCCLPGQAVGLQICFINQRETIELIYG